ncbi:YugN-like family protein [Metabacillus fastidiosus]|uniref:YugN-like family protein n=1 Tax=Metabacillus fastidiosus TaxID=1458 RepID=UPI002DB7BECE|nr:YugN-like family protein [Metabacillus fastidiosus]MEC2078287.1 YugN-like family protein [Metabacillus fastidiosus]
MIEISSKLEDQLFDLFFLEQKMKPLGYVIGGNWDYDSGSFDYKMDDELGYQFLRLPFEAVNGQLDADNVTVKFKRPFLPSHKYQIGLDDDVHVGNFSSAFNQFQEPQDKDATFPEKYIDNGKRLVKELETLLINEQK